MTEYALIYTYMNIYIYIYIYTLFSFYRHCEKVVSFVEETGIKVQTSRGEKEYEFDQVSFDMISYNASRKIFNVFITIINTLKNYLPF